MKKTEFAILVLIAMVSLSGCASAPFNPVGTFVPDVPEYPIDMQAKAADEMEKGCADMPIVCDTFMPDYLVMRDQARSLKKLADI
jgi:hypothetical protein